MSELTNIHARNIRDLTTPISTGAEPDTFDNAKIPIGNAPQGFEGTEALTVKQIKDLAAGGRKEELDAVNLKIKNEEIRAKEVEAALINDKANKATTLSGYGITDAYTQGQIDSKVNNLESKKANKVDVNTALSNLSTTANKYYSTLAAANADIANIAVNQTVTIGEAANGGLWYKATAGATSLTKSPYDPLAQAKGYADANAVFKPLVNPSEKNLDNLGYSFAYFNNVSDVTLENNFPVVNTPSHVLTYNTPSSVVKYQRVILPFSKPVRIFDRSFTGTWSEWTETATQAQVSANTTAISNLDSRVFSKTGKNLFDKSKAVGGEQYSPSNGRIIVSSVYRRSDFIPVTEGKRYTLSGNLTGTTHIAWYATADKNAPAISDSSIRTAVAPIGANFAVFNITNTGAQDTTYDSTTQFEEGSQATAYEPYKQLIDKKDVDGLEQALAERVTENDIFEKASFNLIDPSKVSFTTRYSTGSKTIISDLLPIAASDYIPVTEGEWYTVSGTAIFGLPYSTSCQGGYFSSNTATTAVDNISFVAPVSGAGAAFKVPTGLGITHVIISLDKTEDGVLDGWAQMEVGEMPTAYQEYNVVPKIKDSLLPNNNGGGSGTSVSFDDATWYNYVNADGAKIYQDKLPKFRKAMLLKNEDVVVVNSGTSLTARTSEHSTMRSDAAFRPPMMHSNAFCSLVWDALKWEGQQYRRYDSGYFTEVGSFNTSSSLTEWDDGAYRDGLTRYSSDATASVSFVVPINAWQFNFIYRTDSLGCNAKISVAEGVGKLQVFDETSDTWVEAHNFTFSQLEATPVTRTVDVPSTVTTSIIPTVLASKGNTTYQKRLKLRCRDDTGTFKSLDSVKNVTISRTGGGSRFMYWGVEWSPRQYMITYINAARGSHNTSATGATGLPRFQDNEIWSFKPTLILSELGIHNDGAAAAGSYPVGHWQGLAHNYVTNTDYELSMFSRAAHFGNTDVEYAFFTASIAWNFGGIEEDGSLKYSLQSSSGKGKAKMMSALDKYQEATEYLNSVGIPCIDAAKRWVDAGVSIFGDLRAATLGSGKGGATFTNEGSHWNDTGSKIMAKAVIPII